MKSFPSRDAGLAALRAARLLVALVAPVALIASALPASASDGPRKPTTLTVIGSKVVLGISDLGAQGPTPGDLRTLSLALTTVKGVPMGRASIVQVLVAQEGAQGTATKTVVLNLPKGSISILGTTQFTDITDPTGRPNDSTEQLAIVGGTGAYQGAYGQADILVLPDFTSRWVLRLYLR